MTVTRPYIMHHAAGDWAKRATCGALLSRVHYEESPERVTCKRCLKLIGASAVKPADRRAVAASGSLNHPGFGAKYEGRCDTCGCRGTSDGAPDCNCNGYLSERVELLERLLLEVVRRWDAWEVSECSPETAELKLSNLTDAIEAARKQIWGRHG